MHHHPGTALGAFRLAAVVGRGGMGVVFRAHQEGLGREVAVKLVSPEWCGDPRLRARFRREARLAASVEHPHVLPIYDAGEVDGVAYVAMRYVPGPDLRALVRAAGPLDPERAARLVAQVGAALDAAHRRGLVHRDVKPSNVLVDEVDGQDHAYLTDFGLAQLTADGRTLTAEGAWAGTADYAAPEQIRGGRGDARTDVYALGGVLLWALTGEVPFRRDSQEARLWAHLSATPPSPSARVPGLPPALDAVVARAMAKDPDDRFPSAGALGRAALEAVGAAVPALARPAGDGDAGGDEPATVDALPAPALTGTAVGPPPSRADDTRTLAGGPRHRHGRRRVLAASVVLAASLASAVSALGGSDDEASAGRRVPAGDARSAARPYDFDGDHRQEIAVGLPGDGRVLVLERSVEGALRPAWDSRADATDTAAGQETRHLGRALASGDFDGDGHADLAIGAAGAAGSVLIVRGSRDGLSRGRAARLGTAGRAHGAALAAGDVDRDGYADLVVGVPEDDARPEEDYGSGTVRVVFGSPSGLDGERIRVLRRPRRTDALFGSALALADVDGDGHLDLAESAPGAPRSAFGAVPGHASYCPGGPDGPRACRPMDAPGGSAPTALAMGDVTGDGRADVVHGVAATREVDRVRRRPGMLRIWPGTPRGPAARALVLTQDSPGVRGHDQPRDGFGTALAVADLDRDGHADLVVGAPGEDADAGRVTIIHGGPSGHAAGRGALVEDRLDGDPVTREAGDRFGAALTLVDADGDRRLDLVAAHPGEDGGAGAITVVRGAGRHFDAAAPAVVALAPRRPGTRGGARAIRLGRRGAS